MCSSLFWQTCFLLTSAPTGLGHEPQREGATLSGSADHETRAGAIPAVRFLEAHQNWQFAAVELSE